MKTGCVIQRRSDGLFLRFCSTTGSTLWVDQYDRHIEMYPTEKSAKNRENWIKWWEWFIKYRILRAIELSTGD